MNPSKKCGLRIVECGMLKKQKMEDRKWNMAKAPAKQNADRGRGRSHAKTPRRNNYNHGWTQINTDKTNAECGVRSPKSKAQGPKSNVKAYPTKN
jgi:hypothetical protein